MTHRRALRLLLILLLTTALAHAGSLDFPALQADLNTLASTAPARLGVCVSDGKQSACLRPNERFSLQSVMKLPVGFAVLDAIDAGRFHLDQRVTLRREDTSVFMQPVIDLLGPNGYTTTLGDLIRRANIDSDSAAADYLARLLGGIRNVQRTLTRKGVRGLRIDRDERDLQTEIVGLRWGPQYYDPKRLTADIAAVHPAVRERAYKAYQTDPRDTATPTGMAEFLLNLHAGRLLKPITTAFLLKALADCATGLDRLKAGTPPTWKLAHKTGTAGSWNGISAATNDVGLLTSPQGSTFAVAVFVADSPAPSEARAALIAKVAALVTQHHQK